MSEAMITFFGRRIYRLLTTGLLLLNITPGTALAGGMFGCEDIISFRGANVNNYVKEFEGISSLHVPPELEKTGNMLAQLIQLDGLYSQIGYGPLGYIFIDTSKGTQHSCSNARINQRINRELVDQHGALLLSGNFQQVKEQVYLLTQLEYQRKKVDETVSLLLPGGSKGEAFQVLLPTTTISFTPRKFTLQQMLDVFSTYTQHMKIHKQASSESPEKSFNPARLKGFSYSVQEVKRNWLKLQSRSPGFPSGWIEVPSDVGEMGLREILPELYFVDAVAVYLQIRVGKDTLNRSSYQKKFTRFESLLNTFATRSKGVNDRRALGMLKALQIALILERPGFKFSKESVNRIATLANQAAIAYPTSREARTLMVLTKYLDAVHRGENREAAITTLEKDLLKIISSDPKNAFAKANLERLWRFRQTIDDKNWQTEKIAFLRERFNNDLQVRKLLSQ